MTIDEAVKTVRNTDRLRFDTSGYFIINCCSTIDCEYCPLSSNNTPDHASYCNHFNPKEIYDHLREHYPEELI